MRKRGAQSLVNQAAGVINTSAVVSVDQVAEMVALLADKGIGELIMILLETSLVKISIQAISLIITVVVYGRMFEIYIYSSVSAIQDKKMEHDKSISILLVSITQKMTNGNAAQIDI